MSDNVAVILVNDIEVGTMPLIQYQKIVRAVKKDWRIWFDTFIDSFVIFFKAGAHILFTFIRSIGILIALFMLASLFQPQAELEEFIYNSTPDGIAYCIRTLTTLGISLTGLYYPFRIIYFGFPAHVTPKERAINKKIREVMEVPTEGKVEVIFKKHGANCVR